LDSVVHFCPGETMWVGASRVDPRLWLFIMFCPAKHKAPPVPLNVMGSSCPLPFTQHCTFFRTDAEFLPSRCRWSRSPVASFTTPLL